MTKLDNATQGKFTYNTTLQATDWETFLVCTGVVVSTFVFPIVFSIV
jgi:hypothetical protein